MRAISWLWSVSRPQILAMVFGSTLTYQSIYTNELSIQIPLLAVWDWSIVNLTNKITDVEEDAANGIPGTAGVAKHKGKLSVLLAGMCIAGLAVGAISSPMKLTMARLAFTAIGLAYNIKLLPVLGHKRGEFVSAMRRNGGWPVISLGRFKEMYLLKNNASAVLFTLSVFLYPLYGLRLEGRYPLTNTLLNIAFFYPLELTYEIIYDLRDVKGDIDSGVRTIPVEHGVPAAKKLIYALLAVSAAVPIIGGLTGHMRRQEWLVVAGALQQVVLMRVFCGGRRLPTSNDTTLITWLGAAQLLFANAAMQVPALRAVVLQP